MAGFGRLLRIGNIYAIKYDSRGKIIWERSRLMNHEFNINHENEMNGIAIDSLNNILVTGSIHNGTNWDYYTVKYEGTPPLAKSPPKSLPIHSIIKILNNNRCKNHTDLEGCQVGQNILLIFPF